MLTSAALSEATPSGICVLSFSVVSCKILLMTALSFSWWTIFFLVHFVCLFMLSRDEDTEGALRLGRNSHSDAQAVFESRFLAQLPASNPCRILTYRVMFCFNQIKKTGESIKCTCKSHDCKSCEYLEIKLSLTLSLDTKLGYRPILEDLSDEGQWSTLWKDLEHPKILA